MADKELQPFRAIYEGYTQTLFALDVGDEYHTMDELYEHRLALCVALWKVYDNYITPIGHRVKCWKSLYHSDGSMFPGFFVVGMTITRFTDTVQITYHYKLEEWKRFNVIEYERAPTYDGHTSRDVIQRLLEL